MNIRYPIYEGVYRILTYYGTSQGDLQQKDEEICHVVSFGAEG